MIRLGLIITLLTCALVSSAAQALSFGDIGIIPGDQVPGRTDNNFHYQLNAGAQLEDSLKLINTGSTPQTINLVIESGHVNANNTFSCQAGQTDAATWLKLSQSQILALPGSVTVTKLNLTIPKDTVPGEHNACLTTTVGSSSKTNSGISLGTQLAFRIAINVAGQTDWQLDLGKPKLTSNQKDVSLTVSAQNTSPISLRSQSQVSFISSFPSHRPSNQPNGALILLPHAKANIVINNLGRSFWGGWYKIRLTTNYRPDISDLSVTQSRTIATDLSYFVWPKPEAWLLLALLGLVITFITKLVIKYKNRRHYRLRRSN